MLLGILARIRFRRNRNSQRTLDIVGLNDRRRRYTPITTVQPGRNNDKTYDLLHLRTKREFGNRGC